MKDYNTIIGIIEFRERGFSFRTMINRFKVGVGTIERTLKLFDSSELTLDELKAMEPKDVEELFYPHEQIRRKNLPLPDFAECYRRIHAPGSKVNIDYLNKISDYDLLIIDDFGYSEDEVTKHKPLNYHRMFEVLNAREQRKATIIAAQIPRSDWYDLFNNDTYADACMDRIVKGNYLLELEGPSLR